MIRPSAAPIRPLTPKWIVTTPIVARSTAAIPRSAARMLPLFARTTSSSVPESRNATPRRGSVSQAGSPADPIRCAARPPTTVASNAVWIPSARVMGSFVTEMNYATGASVNPAATRAGAHSYAAKSRRPAPSAAALPIATTATSARLTPATAAPASTPTVAAPAAPPAGAAPNCHYPNALRGSEHSWATGARAKGTPTVTAVTTCVRSNRSFPRSLSGAWSL